VTVALRDFRAEDGDSVTRIVGAAFGEYRNVLSDWAAFSAGFGHMVAHAQECEIIVAEVNGQIAGAVGYIGPGQPKPAHYPPDWTVIRLLVVSPEYRGAGIGRALTEDCIRRGRRDNAPLIALHTSPIMSVALPMYERMGFVLERSLPDKWGIPYGLYVKHLRVGA
jgi:ribosomal protein S18 acetylase RimI-like enzyme